MSDHAAHPATGACLTVPGPTPGQDGSTEVNFGPQEPKLGPILGDLPPKGVR